MAVDERDSSREDHDPRFRVHLFSGGDLPGTSWTTHTYNVSRTDVLEVVDPPEREQATASSLSVSSRTPPIGRQGAAWSG